MPPPPTIGHYRIVSKLGEGGMGEVWRATDTRLNREVAVKLLPAAFASDPMRMARFAREAQVLASLNHPGIAAIYGVEQNALIMELVEGPTLAERTSGGAIPLDDALPIATQIAEALEYAHERGVIHRDLKPANIKITPEGRVKILDFGLAKAMTSDASASALADAPTLSSPATLAGTILGTAAYMSPEQARGQNVDRRADIWAFGVVVYEMLTGQRPFGGPTLSDTLAAVLRGEPDLGKLPEPVRTLVECCLRKDPHRRWQAIGDVRLALEGTLPVQTDAAPPLQRLAMAWRVAALLLAITAAALAVLYIRKAPPPAPVARVTVSLPAGETLIPNEGRLAISPDGSMIAFTAVASASGSLPQLFLRRLDQNTASAVAGTTGAASPVFSPDGQWIAFVAGGELQKVPVAGGTPIALCADEFWGESWGAGGMIYFAANGGIEQVPAAGGTPRLLPRSNSNPGGSIGLSPRWPEVLPDGRSFLYTAGGAPSDYSDDANIVVQSLKTGQPSVLIQGGTAARYLASGYLIYAQGGRLLAVPFNLRRLELTGESFPVVEDVWQASGGASAFAVSRTGSLVYINGGEGGTGGLSLVDSVDRSGVAHQVAADVAGRFANPALSPDGTQLAMEVAQGSGSSRDIWILDLARGTLTRLTFMKAGVQAIGPAWTPDGKRLIYTEVSAHSSTLAMREADGAGGAETLFTSPEEAVAESVSPDGRSLVFERLLPAAPDDLWLLPLAGGGKPAPLVESAFNTMNARISPDGHWLAYQSGESGREEVFVQPFPGLGGKWQISTDGGGEPHWSHDGREIVYENGQQMMAVAIDTSHGFSAGPPHLLFKQPTVNGNWDLSPDGQRFLMLTPRVSSTAPSLELHVILNWTTELQRLASGATH